MTARFYAIGAFFCATLFLVQCTKDDKDNSNANAFVATKTAFGANVDPGNLANYANQPVPPYIRKDNTGANTITDKKATLGRVLFYDKNLSIDNSISCGSCHKQQFAFGDNIVASNGVAGGLTSRHTMRLVNARFGIENKFFWDERAATLELQTTMPIANHAEMGFSGQSGRPAFATLISKLQSLDYYKELFGFVYGDATVTELRMQECLAQFVRSIQSFDAKYDAGLSQANNPNANFPNFTAQENAGKNLFMQPAVFDATGNRIGGGLGCNGCHNAPEFDIDPNSRNNGIIGNLNATGIDLLNTRSPSLRDLTNASGALNGQLMHTGVFTDLQTLVGHYGNIQLAPGNTNLDPRLRPNGFGQKLHLTAAEVNSVIAFIKTLSGNNVYTDKKWANPFL